MIGKEALSFPVLLFFLVKDMEKTYNYDAGFRMQKDERKYLKTTGKAVGI